MNNIKLFMLLIMAATSSVAIADETPSVDWSIVGNGSTLTISGYGDLTNASKSDWKTVFSTAAYGNVFFNNEGGGVDVEENFLYFPNSTYYEATHTWSGPLFNGGVPTNGYEVNNVTSSTSWKTNVDDVNLYPVHQGNDKTIWYSANYHIYHINGVTSSRVWDTSKTNPSGGGVYIYEVTASWPPELGWDERLTIGNRVIDGTPDLGETIKIDADNGYYSKYYVSSSPLNNGDVLVASQVYTNLLKTDEQIYNYCTTVETVTISDADNVHDFNETNTGLNYNSFRYLESDYSPFVLSSNELFNGAEVPISQITLIPLASVTDYRRSYKEIIFDYNNAGKVSSSAAYPNYIGTFTIGDVSYVNYAIFDQAYTPGTAFAPDDIRMTLLTSLSEYTNSSTTYVCASDNLYRSQDGGTTKTKLTNGTTYNYTAGDLFYTSTGVEYSAIPNNEEYFSLHSNYIEHRKIAHTFKHDLLAAMHEGETTYTRVVFVNSSTADNVAMTIDPEIVQAILFPHKETEYSNSTITELDLGQATTTSFDHLLDHPTKAYLCPVNLANVTLPLVATVANEVVLPANVIPSVYNGSSANLRTVTVPEGYTKIGDSAFKVYDDHTPFGSTQITTINLPTTLKEIGDEAFIRCSGLSNLNISDPTKRVAGRSIVLPASLTKIGKEAFYVTGLASSEEDPFILPTSLESIGIGAFYGLTSLKFLQLNEGLKYVGNSAFALSAEIDDQKSITFPSTIKYLGPASFVGRWYMDIYFSSKSAPVCPLGTSPYLYDWGNLTAFSTNIQMGNNGFTPIGVTDEGTSSTIATGSTADDTSMGYANRENYVASGTYHFTLLHFPDGITTEQAKTFRDITRKYVTGTFDADGNFTYKGYGSSIHDVEDPNTRQTYGNVFKETSTLNYYMGSGETLTCYCTSNNLQPGFIDTYLGAQAVWPSQAQWMRNFITVANGLEWDGVSTYRPTLTEDMFKTMKEDGLVVGANTYDTAIDLTEKTWSELSTDEKDYLSLILYQGTRRFVLSYDGGYSVPFIIPMQGGLWWSICLPFSLTKNEVDDIFGEGTHVCLMSAVDRIVTTEPNGKNTLVLKFKNDVYRHKTERTGGEITATGRAYTYASNFSTSNAEPGPNETVLYARESYMIFPKKDYNDAAKRDFGSPVFEDGAPLPTMVQVNRENGEFIDGFNQQYLINGSDPVYRFIGNFTSTVYTTANETTTAVTVKVPKYSYAYGKMDNQRKFFILNTDKAAWSPFKSIVQNTAVGGGADDWNNFFQQNTARVNQVSLFGDDEEVTGIDNVIIEVSSDNDEDFRVFNLNGSMMGNSLQGLPAGTYIQGGKAYRVK